MLLPSALSCDFLVPSNTQSAPPPVSPRRATRQTSPSPYQSPPQENAGIISATTTGWVHACRRLQQILSVDRLTPVTSAPLLITSSQSGIRKNTSRRSGIPTLLPSSIQSSPSPSSLLEIPATPLRRSNGNSLRIPPRTPLRRTSPNKRTRATAFATLASPVSTDCEQNSAKDLTGFVTPQRAKRQRLTTPPPPPDRGPTRKKQQQNFLDDIEDSTMADWTADDDRQLVEMVLGKMKLSKTDWEDCARTLGKGNSKTVGKRFENLLGNIALRNRRNSRIGRRR